MKWIKRLSFLLALLLLALSACGNEGISPEAPESVQESAENRSESVGSVPSAEPPETVAAATEEHTVQRAEEIASDSEEWGGKTLIAYFSLADIVPEGADASTHATPAVGNTESAALEIGALTGGDLFAIKTVQTYPVSHRECSVIAEEEMRSDARPALSTHVENMEEYDTVYLGYPIWWYQEPMAIRTFLEEYDFSGKTVIPFCTTLGAGVEQSVDTIRALCPDSIVLEGLTIYTGRDGLSESVSEWLEEIGMAE